MRAGVQSRRLVVAGFACAGMVLASAAPAAEPLPHVIRGALYTEPFTPRSIDVDLRALPAPPPWQPGDSIRDVPRRHRFKPTVERDPAPQEDPLLGTQAAATVKRLQRSFTTPEINRSGQVYTGAVPPDTVGDVGRLHYIQAVNHASGSQFTVYDKVDGHVVAGPLLLSSLGGSGGCAAGKGDPIVLYDHLADRWLLSEFAESANTLCVYISKTSDPVAGGWYNYQFNTPQYPDYPKVSLWTNAYAVTSNESFPSYYALERSRMLAGLSAGMQSFTAPALAGFDFQSLTPCDLDGQAPPPGTPHYAMRHRDDEAHNAPLNNPSVDYLDLFEVNIDWTTPALSKLTGPISIPVAEFDSHLKGYTTFQAIPQKGSASLLDPLREVVMWRLQYRNFSGYQTLVGCFVTDVNGADHAGMRWFELRRTSGAWAVYQQGTLAPDVHHRWMGSIAMDGSGNIAMGYNVSSSTLYPSLRYAGRLASDPLGSLPQGEFSVAAGAASNAGTRYGDYSAMTVDPVNDCTFWLTGEYNVGGNWSTRIAAMTFDACGCTVQPPATVTATPAGDNRIDVSWSASDGADSYSVYRAIGTCPQNDYTLLASGVTATSYADTDASGGITLAYVVRSFDGQKGCESTNSLCASSAASGACTAPPLFGGLAAATNAGLGTCAIRLSWNAAVPRCGPDVVYHVYRSTAPAFVPADSNRIASCLFERAYEDRTVAPGAAYTYIVRAEDPAAFGDGPCVGGATDTNTVRRSASATGLTDSLFADSMESGTGLWVAERPTVDASSEGWKIVTTYSYSPTHAYFCLNETTVKDRAVRMATGVSLPVGQSATLEFRHRYDTESGFDGGVLEYSVNGGSTWFDILAGNGGAIPANSSRFLSGGYSDIISAWYGNPISGRWAWSGASGGFQLARVDLSQLAGFTVAFRWRLGCDDIGAATGWWLDDVRITRQVSCLQGGYDAWKVPVSWRGSDAPGADDNADGVPNYQAYFFGVNPTGVVAAAEVARLPGFSREGSNILYGFTVNTAAVMAASFSVHTRTNLLDGQWRVVLPPPAPDAAGRVSIPVQHQVLPQSFYRLRMQE